MTFKTWIVMLRPYWTTFLLIQFFTRLFLLFYSGADIIPIQFIQIFGSGLVFDIQVLGFFMVPVICVHLFSGQDGKATGFYRVIRFISFFALSYCWLFAGVAEYFFWEEFGTRFNFIAVDYLVYTTEVIGNIRESYPLFPILGALALMTCLLTWCWRRQLAAKHEPVKGYSRTAIALIVLPFLLCIVLSDDILPQNNDQAVQELSKNGTYALFSAYRNNELDFKGFYMVEPERKVATYMRNLLEEDENQFLNNDPEDITRVIRRQGPELHKNVIMVVMESMSAEYMQSFGNTNELTPNLDRLAKEGLFFTNLYATGTRTVRGLEALSLSIPPTPGQSILRRKNNGGLFTIGSVFDDRGYDTAFIYGGHGYFDNMNAYFSANGFRIVDRTSFDDKDIRFSNVWGVSDEDLFDQVIKQADAAQQNKKPFFYMVMTTSNHRPYTFPAGRIDLPVQGGGRAAGVKYADFSVGELIKNAQKKDWFKDTVFIFVADHTAGAGGKTELSLQKYHIPAIFYAPGFIKPQRYESIASQIDVPPVLCGLLNFSYATKFFGEDLLNDDDEKENAHAFISNYQKIGLLRMGELSVLEPKRIEEQYIDDRPVADDKEDHRLMLDTVSYYQYAAGWRERMKRVPTLLQPVK